MDDLFFSDHPVVARCFAFGVLMEQVIDGKFKASDFEISYLTHVYDSISAILLKFGILKE